MFSNAARPKAGFTEWVHLYGRLLTSDRLIKWEIDVDAKYALSLEHDETKEHLFVQCTYARLVITRLLQWIQQQCLAGINWEQHVTEVVVQAKGKTQQAQAFKMIYTKFVHGIWKERN
ncbi:uncharacterized protein LOC132628376 [Lycium barbarum]|uniref:uncharacterized protein LOC132628376 n=1 Tax=Lycium barbarum TaxID=112863 RepID=UPI00293ED58C|nr:uncharacterized protein LOC132628376 [Lycium barbarum]